MTNTGTILSCSVCCFCNLYISLHCSCEIFDKNSLANNEWKNRGFSCRVPPRRDQSFMLSVTTHTHSSHSQSNDKKTEKGPRATVNLFLISSRERLHSHGHCEDIDWHRIPNRSSSWFVKALCFYYIGVIAHAGYVATAITKGPSTAPGSLK